MQPLAVEQFADFFQAVHGDPPFDWQRRLAKEVLTDGFHDVIRAPTACGKTSVLDLAIFELALHAERPPEKRTAAYRNCFVVDRRLVVDEVTTHAGRIRGALLAAAKGERKHPVLVAVADRLASIAPEGDEPLRVVRLRGGVYRDDGWSAHPLTPTILVSTVDQIGSRLLFRGYGVSLRGRPLQAGLLAFDTRIILDEAHLSTVFASTLDRVRQYQQLAEAAPLPHPRSVSVVRMSATTSDAKRTFVFGQKPREWQDQRLKARLEASKPAELIEVEVEPIPKQLREKQPRKAREQEQKNRAKMAHELARRAKTLARIDTREGQRQDCPQVIGIVVNRVATARRVFDVLRKVEDGERERDAILLTGRVRPYDRDRLLEEWLPRMKAGREGVPDRPLFVAATQTVEVGANLDFDALVTEAAPLDALRQRFGRLDRLGKRHERRAPSPACILIRSDQRSKSDDDRVYGPAIAQTWKGLKELSASAGKKKAKQSQVDFGIKHLDPKLPKETDKLRGMLAPQSEVPVLFPAHLDAWVQTDPLPEPDPDVAPFLHGRPDAPADVQVVWRADLNRDDERLWAKIVSLMPPRTREALPVPVYEVRAWLSGQAEGDVADVEGARDDTPPEERRQGRRVLRWRGEDDAELVGPDGVRPGDTIIVPASDGGADEYGWAPSSRKAVEDVAEACLAEVIASYPLDAFRRPKLRLRLHPDLLPEADDQTSRHLRALVSAAARAARADGHDPWPSVRALINILRNHVKAPSHRAVIDAFRAAGSPRIDLYPDARGIVLSAPLRISQEEGRAAVAAEMEYEEPHEDEASLAPCGRQVLLSTHSESVGDTAAQLAMRSGLPDLVEVLRAAGRWHDQGKRDFRFQAWLHGSELKALAASSPDQPLAKSGRDPKEWKRSDAYGYPRGSRHEFVSVRLFEQTTEGIRESGDLVKFLIGTHHGHGRPFPPVLRDARPVEVGLQHDGKHIATTSDHRLYRLDSGWVDLFWRMVRRYGWWGVAYLEALLITADRWVSAQEQRVASSPAVATTAVR